MILAGALSPAADPGKENSKAADHSPVIDQWGEDDWVLTPPGLDRIVFIHYKKDFAKPPWAGGEKKEKESSCYALLGRGVRLKSLPVDYVINPVNPDNLGKGLVVSEIMEAADEWDTHTASSLFGTAWIDYMADWDSNAPDGRNEFVFENYPDDGVIAVTVVWGYFSGPPSIREIVEFDILFNTDFYWGDASGGSYVMDLQNIATHELGHGLGLDDLYETTCLEETMFGYSSEGEIDKRTLEAGDIVGLEKLYGP
jgi:hypothetical protein